MAHIYERRMEEDRLRVFERRILRKIYGLMYDQDIKDRMKGNYQELMEIFNKPNSVNEIKRSNFEWSSHTCRKQDSIVVHRVFHENPSSKRPLDRPRLR